MESAINGVQRITPAGAGKTFCGMWIYSADKDHPRRCGENLAPSPNSKIQLGSPPQVRGKLKCFIIFNTAPRITPAGAGKTNYIPFTATDAEDHPRRCGENLLQAKTACIHSGSPPQVRGKHTLLYPRCVLPRITPAGAGKTFPFS